MWVADKHIELHCIRLDAADIYITTQWYDNINVIYGSNMVYRLYFDHPPQVQIHTQLMHGKTSMNKIYGAAQMHTSAGNKSTPP